jgi:hypothetical protein
MTLKKIVTLLLFLTVSLFFAGELFADDEIGMVFTAKGAVSAARDGKTIALSVKDKVHAKDVISTGAGTKAQLLLNDKTSISLGENTTLEMSEFANAGKESRFSARLGKGVMRVITGEITKNNPDGFKVTTPRATVGIRGTIVVIEVNENRDTVTVLNSEFTVLVNGVEVQQDSMVTVGDDGTTTVEPITQEQKDASNGQFDADGTTFDGNGASGGGDSAAFDAGSGQRLEDSGIETIANDSLTNSTQASELNPLADIIQIPLPEPEPIPVPEPERIASVVGSLASDLGNPFSGTFSFNINLLNGDVTNAALQGSGSVMPFPLNGGAPLTEAAFSVNLNGGSGWFSNNVFDISKFSGTATFGGNVVTGLENSYMNGGVDVNDNVRVDEYAIANPDYLFDVGSGSGRMTR